MGRKNTISDFWKKVRKTKSCWIWTGGSRGKGYGGARCFGKNYLAHRLAYECLIGKIPDNMVLDHLCRNRNCVNPDHLEPVTNKTNVLRGNGVTARNSKKEFCIHGHRLSGNNIAKVKGKNERRCRKCHNIRRAKYYKAGKLT